MSKYLEGMSEYDKGFVDGNQAKEALQAELKAQLEREARIDELNKLSLHQGTTSNGTDDIQVTLDYITKRIKELESE